MTKTNACRILEREGIPYRIKEYDFDADNLSGELAAEKIGMPKEQVFKTLVTRGDKTGVTIFCIPVNGGLQLKKAAQVSGNKKIEMVPVKELFALTGYIRGGCSPIGMKKRYPTFIDETILLFDEIALSAGVRGCQVLVPPEQTAAFLEAVIADLTSDN